jgi:hypothetical protein
LDPAGEIEEERERERERERVRERERERERVRETYGCRERRRRWERGTAGRKREISGNIFLVFKEEKTQKKRRHVAYF